jgi:hypothetical protein
VQPAAQLQMWINWKTDGPDRPGNANEEFIALRNAGTAPVNLAGWGLRDASHLFGSDSSAGAGSDSKTYFVFPNGTRVSSGQTVHVYPGSGNNNVSNLDFYMNKSALPFWRNVHKADPPRTFLGKANAAPGAEAFLVDTELNFRGWAAYPCVVACTAPTVAITDVDPLHTSESVTLKNTGATPADMTGAVLDYDGLIKKFPTGYTIAPGSTVVVHVAKDGNDNATDLYWPQGSKDHLLRDAGGSIWLRTWNDVTIDFAKWGDGNTGSGEPYDY